MEFVRLESVCKFLLLTCSHLRGKDRSSRDCSVPITGVDRNNRVCASFVAGSKRATRSHRPYRGRIECRRRVAANSGPARLRGGNKAFSRMLRHVVPRVPFADRGANRSDLLATRVPERDPSESRCRSSLEKHSCSGVSKKLEASRRGSSSLATARENEEEANERGLTRETETGY